MNTISVVINTLNEQKRLPHALASIKDFADEVVVVDMNSDDETVSIAKKFGAKVFMHERMGYVEPARNFAIDKTTSDWAFILDADEVLSPTLKKSLKGIAQHPTADYFRIPRKNIIFGKWIKHSHWWPDLNIRFFKKGFVSWNEIIHSVPTTQGAGADLESTEDNAIVHNHYETIDQYIERLNRYTTAHAASLQKKGYDFSWTDLINKPMNEFLSRYFQGQGYRDGVHGLALSGLQAFSEFVIYLKVWQEQGFIQKQVSVNSVVKRMKDAQSDLYFWQSDTLLKEYGGIKHRIKRKFRLP